MIWVGVGSVTLYSVQPIWIRYPEAICYDFQQFLGLLVIPLIVLVQLIANQIGKHHILLIGPTGVGKTYLVKTLADYLQVPVGFTSATGLVESGYKGDSVESLVRTLLDRAGGNPKQAEKGIVFIDEIDKIRRGETGGRDVSGEGVQNSLLTLLDLSLIHISEPTRPY